MKQQKKMQEYLSMSLSLTDQKSMNDLKAKLKKDKFTFYATQSEVQYKKTVEIKYALFQLPQIQRSLLKNIIMSMKTQGGYDPSFLSLVLLPDDIKNEDFIKQLIDNPELFENEGKFYPHFNEKGQMTSISPFDAINMLFCKSFVNDIFTVQVLAIIREVVSDDMFFTMIENKLNQNEVVKNNWLKKQLDKICLIYHALYSEYLTDDIKQRIEKIQHSVSSHEEKKKKDKKKKKEQQKQKERVEMQRQLDCGDIQSLMMSQSLFSSQFNTIEISALRNIKPVTKKEMITIDKFVSKQVEDKFDIKEIHIPIDMKYTNLKNHTNHAKFENINCDIVAQQLFIYDKKLLQNITLGDVIRGSANYLHYADVIEYIAKMVRNYIVNQGSSMFNHFIEIAYQSYKIGSFNMASVIVFGLTFCEDPKYSISSSNKKIFADLKEIFSHQDYNRYKEEFLKHTTSVKIPVVISHISAMIIRNSDKKYDPNDEVFNNKQFALRMEEIGKWLAFLFVAQQSEYPYEEIVGLQSYFGTLQSNKALQKSSMKDRCESIKNSLKYLNYFSIKMEKQSEVFLTSGTLYNYVLQYRSQDKLGMFFKMKDGTLGCIYTDFTILMKHENDYYYVERNGIIPKKFKNEESFPCDVKKVNIIKDIEPRFMKVSQKNPNIVVDKEKKYQTSLVKLCKQKVDHTYFEFVNGTIHVFFDDSELSYFINTNSLKINIIKEGEILVESNIDNKEMLKTDPNAEAHLDILEFLLRNMISKRDVKK